MDDALLALGSNLGDRKALVDEALARLSLLPRSKLGRRSSYYRTAPVGPVRQEWFLNVAAILHTGLDPATLLTSCHAIEAALGRRRQAEIYWGPRPIDIDLIAFADMRSAGPFPRLPHPRFAERAFVLVPLAEIAADLRIEGRSIGDYLAAVDTSGVAKLDWAVP